MEPQYETGGKIEAWSQLGELGRPLNMAHRGASRRAPENTIAAFRLGIELGAEAIELDVQLSADGVPVVMHDASVERTTDGAGLVSSLSLAELKSLDAGSSFGPAYAGEPVPTLAEVLEAVGGQTLINIELKSASAWDTGVARRAMDLVADYGLADRCFVSSFNPLTLRRAKRRAPAIPAGLIYAPNLPLVLRRAWLAPFVPHEARHPQHTMVDARYMAWARRRGHWVNAWTVDDPEEMRRLIALGVNVITTNTPDVLRDVLAASRSGPAAR